MKLQIKIISVTVTALLILTFIPTIASPIPKVNIENLSINKNMINNNVYKRSDTVKIRVLHIKEDGTYENSIKTITLKEQKSLWEKLKNIDETNLSLSEIFENKFQVLKDYEIVSCDLNLEQIVDTDILKTRYESVNGENFEADYAPLLYAGGGFGFGFGIPFFITSGTFLMVLFGFGLVLCFDFLNDILYTLLTPFFIPMLIGYLGGFVGLLLLPVVPGFFYSNAFGMGFATKTSWMLVPSGNLSGA